MWALPSGSVSCIAAGLICAYIGAQAGMQPSGGTVMSNISALKPIFFPAAAAHASSMHFSSRNPRARLVLMQSGRPKPEDEAKKHLHWQRSSMVAQRKNLCSGWIGPS